MSLLALASGVLFRAPEQKTSKNGRPFVTATIRSKDGEASTWIKLLVFSESAGAELMRLKDGDGVSAQGVLKVETYEKDGSTKIGMTIIADMVIALRQPPKERKPKASAPPPDRHDERHPLARHAGDGEDVFGDSVPF